LALLEPVLALCAPAVTGAEPEETVFVASKEAAARCQSKLKSLDDFANRRKSGQKQTTKITEEEINSFLELNLKPKYHASLKSLVVEFHESRMHATAVVNFDHLRSASTKLLPKLIGLVFSGVHTIAVEGQVLSGNGRAKFQLERARFDKGTLPKYLVEEILSAVGRKQKPPFDPMQPSRMPYEINRIEMHPGYIIVFQ
jgi:hypothetical protein